MKLKGLWSDRVLWSAVRRALVGVLLAAVVVSFADLSAETQGGRDWSAIITSRSSPRWSGSW